MSKEKGPKQFEDGRQKIDVDYSADTHSSNAEKQAKKKMSTSILTPVFLLFICIPIAFIVYFWKFYDPSNVGEQAKMEDNQVVEVAKDSVSAPLKNNTAVVDNVDNEQEELSAEEKAAAALAAQEAAEKAAKAEADRVAQKVAEQKAAEEKAAQEAAAEEERRKAEEEEARRQAAIAAEQARKQAAAEEARRQAAAEAAKKQEQQKQQQQQQQAVRYHTVQPNETLYRISVNYYGSGDAVERIKAANGLASNEISVGQSLKLP